ncbi:unnamed protein product [Spodoptera littoralis]|uniref:Cuticular protein n=1 Tax=Spodoptera littoralis TaxID=7109 RepID=A0A9P0IG11_SPOLI|nr:unnamed protein product [Spodoptera littoralis]CAH1644415.1 unnamed protein product [Spodoptera littoralis]
MIVKMFLSVLLSVNFIYHVNGASYSNVYVQSDLVPRGFYQYGTPHASLAAPRLSQINTLPSIPGYVPCGTPCVYPGQTVATVASVNPQPNILTYGAPAPSIPVVVSPTKEEAAAYEYGYVVYDDNTGDHKAQRELSDGSVVRGEYSFIQPDGYVREVQYQADDISGFNAVVKNFLPAVSEVKNQVEKKESSPPCPEIKHESLIESNAQKEHVHKTPESNEHDHSKSEESVENEHSTEAAHHLHPIKESKEESGEKSHEHAHLKHEHIQHPSKAASKEDSSDESGDKSKEALTVKPKESEEKHHKAPKSSEEESGDASESKESKEELKEKVKKQPVKKVIHSVDKHVKESKEVSVEVSKEESHEGHKHKEVHDLSHPEPLASYSDIIRCIESVMKRNNVVPGAMHDGHPSPLTYIVLNRPC